MTSPNDNVIVKTFVNSGTWASTFEQPYRSQEMACSKEMSYRIGPYGKVASFVH